MVRTDQNKLCNRYTVYACVFNPGACHSSGENALGKQLCRRVFLRMIILFIVAHKYFVEGIQMTGIRG
jgi:hypothetical protein